MSLLETKNLVKRYGPRTVVDGVSLQVNTGAVVGLLGPNGAGKTTFIRIMVGLAAPSAGQFELFGHDLFANRYAVAKHLGAVVEAPIFFEYMTAWDNLHHLAALSGGATRQEIERALDIVGLRHAAGKKVKAFSYGMKQRLGIAQALLPASRFLVLDEPTNGLDPHGIAGVRDLIRYLAREHGMTIFLSSHLLVEVEQICDRVAIIDHGRKVLEGTVAVLKAESHKVIVRARRTLTAETAFAARNPLTYGPDQEDLMAVFELDEATVPQLVRELVEAGVEIREVRRRIRTLEDIFIEHTLTSEDAHGRADTIRVEKAGGREA